MQVSLKIPKVENIRKENKSIDDLLNWNREVTTMIGSMQNATDVDINCEDFKIFNPLNDKLVSTHTFYQLRSLKAGIFDDERFTRYISPQNVLNTPSLKDLTLRFTTFSVGAADLLVRFFRDPNSMQLRHNINIRQLRLEYQDRHRDAILSIMGGVLKENAFI